MQQLSLPSVRHAGLLASLLLAATACTPEPAEPGDPNAAAAQAGVEAEQPTLVVPPRQHREWQPPGGPATTPASPPGPRCAHYSPTRSAFFGDLHVHTNLSLDAYGRGGFQTPDDAYRFAKGEPIGLAPRDADGEPLRFGTIDRPLDFAAVTDHAEWIGELESCTTPDSPAYDSLDCEIMRGRPLTGSSPEGDALIRRVITGEIRGPGGMCGDAASVCREYAGHAWRRTVAAAEAHQDRTEACAFTAFNAWEFTSAPGRSKVHRNVILRNDSVPELPISWSEEAEPEGLWKKLEARCNDTDTGCEALTIPHNPNISNGRHFSVTYKDRPLDAQRERAELQRRLEPLVEMIQSKGESECRTGMWGVLGGEDELCGFEKVRYTAEGARPEDCEESFGSGAMAGVGCQSRLDFVRYGLIEGLREYARIGVNPYRLGFIGSTDTHNGTPGAVEEYNYLGHNSLVDDTLEKRITTPAYAPHPMRNPGGLIGVWAEENARDALFDAMKRRETFATSGVRIQPRLFAGWELPDDLCEDPDAVAAAYAQGIAMGGALDPAGADADGPVFFASALRDPGTAMDAGAGLQRIQMIKGEVDDSGLFRETVVDLALDDGPPAEVDAACRPNRQGANSLCAVWRDPAWNPGKPAVYYARILEQPSCRWHARQCAALPAGERPEACDDNALPRTIQERAWTSAIWYEPPLDAEGS